MQLHRTIKRENGKRVRIWVWLLIDHARVIWSYEVGYCEKGKRKFISDFSTNDYTWRALGMKERQEYKDKIYLQHCTLEEIKAVKKELINSIPLD
jgi:hypothetical protein